MKADTRRMRVSKPMTDSLSAKHTARLHIRELQDIGRGKFLLCPSSPVHIVDPCGSVLGEVPASKTSASMHSVWTVNQETLRKMSHMDVGMMSNWDGLRIAEGDRQYNVNSFMKNDAGFQAIEDYFRGLASLHDKVYGQRLLDDQQTVYRSSPSSGKTWCFALHCSAAETGFDCLCHDSFAGAFGSRGMGGGGGARGGVSVRSCICGFVNVSPNL